MLTPGRGMLPAFTVPCTEPPATVADGADGLLGAALEGGLTAGAAAGGDCDPAGVMREPLNKQKSREMRRIKMNFLLLPTQLIPSSFYDVFRDHHVQISFFRPVWSAIAENKSALNVHRDIPDESAENHTC